MSAEVIKILERIAAAIETNNQLIRENCEAIRELERRRVENRKRVEKHRKYVTLQSEVEKETEDEKRDLPPTPPIERKEEEKEKEVPSSRVRAREGEYLWQARERVTEEGFPIFWKEYPGNRKSKKRDCWHRFHARMKESRDPDALFATMMDAIEKWKKSRVWIEGAGRFIMHPATWLNNESWLPENIPTPMAEDGEDKAIVTERAEHARQLETACVEARYEARKETLARIKGGVNIVNYSKEEINKIKEEFDS